MPSRSSPAGAGPSVYVWNSDTAAVSACRGANKSECPRDQTFLLQSLEFWRVQGENVTLDDLHPILEGLEHRPGTEIVQHDHNNRILKIVFVKNKLKQRAMVGAAIKGVHSQTSNNV